MLVGGGLVSGDVGCGVRAGQRAQPAHRARQVGQFTHADTVDRYAQLDEADIDALGDQVVPHHDHIRLEGLQTRIDDGVRVTDALDTPRSDRLVRARHGGDDTITGPGGEQQLGGTC